ncbi:hypothetical protein PIB30_050986, partial [Stylosanthes scabra]|nr:hypothetical protein [Stylosanthes scabra]
DKNTLAQAIANETGFPFYQISATELVSGVSARSTAGYVSADLVALVKAASNFATKRNISGRKCEHETSCLGDWWKEPWTLEDVDKLAYTISDFQVDQLLSA